MKRIPLYLTASLLISLCFTACERVIDFDTDSESQLVLNAVPSSQRQLFVNFAYSRFFLADTYRGVPDVDMAVSVNGTEYRPDSIVGNNYFFNNNLQDDDSVSILVRTGDRTVTAHTHVPRMPRISPPLAFIDSSGVFDLLTINFNIDDYPGYPERYCFTVTQRDSGLRYRPYLETFDTVDTSYNTMFCCLDKNLTSPEVSSTEAFGGYFYSQLLSSDKAIDGTNHNTTLLIILLKDTNEVEPFIHQYTLNVESVTPDRYQYLKDIAGATSMTQYFTEPAPVHCNVNGALGIFAGNARYSAPLTIATLPPVSPALEPIGILNNIVNPETLEKLGILPPSKR